MVRARNANGGSCRKSGGQELCAGTDPQFAARTLAEAKMLRTQEAQEDLQTTVRVGSTTLRAYVVTAAILEGANDAL